ncbi:hypothetical protein EDB80DRAFT_199157 [Ilyonectria destructans]|nr:hypothetical protein EDB80DRAFT_199157 [Ilyonectria destructans]
MTEFFYFIFLLCSSNVFFLYSLLHCFFSSVSCEMLGLRTGVISYEMRRTGWRCAGLLRCSMLAGILAFSNYLFFFSALSPGLTRPLVSMVPGKEILSVAQDCRKRQGVQDWEMKGIETGRGGKGNRVVVTDIYTHAHMHTHLTRKTTGISYPNTPDLDRAPSIPYLVHVSDISHGYASASRSINPPLPLAHRDPRQGGLTEKHNQKK